MLVYRLIMFNENIERIREKNWFKPNYGRDNISLYCNTFNECLKKGEYLFFYAEDAVRWTQTFEELLIHNNHKPHIAEFDINIDILAEYLGLGIYRNVYEKNYSNDEYYLSLEFSIPFNVIAKNYRDENYKYSCITGGLYPIPYFEKFEKANIPSNISRESYKNFSKLYLPIIMKMLNVNILSFKENSYLKNSYSFDKQADDYGKKEAVKILKKLDVPKRYY